jgi:hypothetical protein
MNSRGFSFICDEANRSPTMKGGMRMEVFLGFAMVILTLAVGTAIGIRANSNVRAFSEEEHEIFVGRKGKK